MFSGLVFVFTLFFGFSLGVYTSYFFWVFSFSLVVFCVNFRFISCLFVNRIGFSTGSKFSTDSRKVQHELCMFASVFNEISVPKYSSHHLVDWIVWFGYQILSNVFFILGCWAHMKMGKKSRQTSASATFLLPKVKTVWSLQVINTL